jgi:hypothetical protein
VIVSERLKNAYMQTTYRVNGTNEPVALRIGVRNDALDLLLRTCRAREWAFVTASNPGSSILSKEENGRRNAQLVHALIEAGLHYLEGAGVPDTPGWEPEQSYLVLGISQRDAVAIAKHHGQCAIVCGFSENPPELVWID